jgi:hypothetical protein
MSKISLAPDASGSGIFTIASPNSNTNRTLTLPDDTGTIVTNSGNQAGSFTTLNTSGAVVFNDAGADVDFRVESDTVDHALFVEGSSGNVGIGVTSINATRKVEITQPSGYTSGLRILSGGSGAYSEYFTGTANWSVGGANNLNALQFLGDGTERMRIDSSGNLLVGTTSGSSNIIGKNTGDTTSPVLTIGNNGDTFTGAAFFGINNVGYTSSNAGAAPIRVGSSTTSRSINAAGTINASGTDYAEYMTKAGEFELAKGDVCGVNSDGNLTNVFADAVAFVVKSTNPSYVGGDSWGNDQAIGLRPVAPIQQAAEVDEEGNETQPAETDEAFAARQAQYETDLAEFEAKLEAERQKVDRIAFSGQVPVNVTGATAGQYIVPVENNGGITGVAVNETDMTLAQYMKAVGKVIAIEEDGRARIIVKVA